MIAEWTTLEMAVNQMRLRLACGSRAAFNTRVDRLGATLVIIELCDSLVPQWISLTRKPLAR